MSKLVPMVMDVKQDVAPKPKYNPLPELWDKIRTAFCGPKHIDLMEWKREMQRLNQE